jgi:hypothetical protein
MVRIKTKTKERRFLGKRLIGEKTEFIRSEGDLRIEAGPSVGMLMKSIAKADKPS